MADRTMTSASEIHIGDKTQIHDQSMWSVSLSPMKSIVRSPEKPIFMAIFPFYLAFEPTSTSATSTQRSRVGNTVEQGVALKRLLQFARHALADRAADLVRSDEDSRIAAVGADIDAVVAVAERDLRHRQPLFFPRRPANALRGPSTR